MERKRELTKILLAESFKELLIKGSFDKITIKMITDQAGVIRPTFYNYFQDKYEETYNSSSDTDHEENHDKFVYYAINHFF